jgi:hypothetical protein
MTPSRRLKPAPTDSISGIGTSPLQGLSTIIYFNPRVLLRFTLGWEYDVPFGD